MKTTLKKAVAWILFLVISSSVLFNYLSPSVFVATAETRLLETYVDSQITGKKLAIQFQYSDSFFSESALSKNVNNNLALTSIALASAAYEEEYIRPALENGIGCTEYTSFNYPKTKSQLTKTDNDYVAVAIGKKKITVNNQTYYLYPICVKGTSGNYEWYSNFRISGYFKYHDGFMRSWTEVVQQIDASHFINTPKEKTILWICGHSRGAAIANLMGGLFSYNTRYTTPDKIYCYTYACPNVVNKSFKDRYQVQNGNNIHNFNNPGDIVTAVPLSKWNYTRFGITHVLPVRTAVQSDIKQKFKNITGKSFEGSDSTTSITNALYDLAGSPAVYHDWDKPVTINILAEFGIKNITIESLLKKLADAFLINNPKNSNDKKTSTNILNAIVQSCANGVTNKIKTLIFSILSPKINSIKNSVIHGHCQETYIAWMQSVYSYTSQTSGSLDVSEISGAVNGSGGNFVQKLICNYKKGAYSVTATSGLNLRKGAGTNTASLGVIPYKTDLAVTEVSGGWGKTEYNGKTGWIYLYYTKYLGANVKPAAPSLRLTSASEIALGDEIAVAWNSVSFASKYQIDIVNTDTSETVKTFRDYTGTSVRYIPEHAGTYQITAKAANVLYTSDAGTLSQKITVHPDVTVRFMVGDDDAGFSEYQTNQVKWGRSLVTLPDIPARIGSNFKGWFAKGSAIQENFKEIKEDLTVYANYQASVYTVKFYDGVDGKYLPVTLESGETVTEQKVAYGMAAVAPTDLSFVKEGSHFIGWNKSFDYVTENMVITAVTDKDNYDLPVKITDVTACRYDYGYEINCNVTNELLENTRGRVVVALKTEDGKLITTTESAAYYIKGKKLASNGTESYYTESIKVVVPNYDDELAKNISADRAEVYAVANFKTTVPVSVNVEVGITDMDPWTEWFTNDELALQPASIRDKCLTCSEAAGTMESKTQYASRTPVYTTTDSSEALEQYKADGWTQYDETSKTVTGNWSTTRPEEKENRVIESKDVAAVTKTTYWYKRYKYYNKAQGAYYYSYASNWATNQGYSGKWEYKSSETELAVVGTVDGVTKYSGTWYRADCSSQGTEHTVYKVTTTVTAAHKEYRAVDTVYTYYLSNWTAWSEWTTTPIAAADSVEVKTEILHRYYINELSHVADTEGVIRTDYIAGNTGTEFAGKQATLFIYKVTEASDWTTEYLAQTTIAEDGSYLFDPYKLREEPSASTGDYTVTLGIEGSNSAVYIGKIEAPKPEYNVTFMYPTNDDATVFDVIPVEIDGVLLESQSVQSGKDAIVPDAPEIEGKTFVGWDMRSTAITQDTEIRAQYIENTYVVTYIDWLNETYEMRTYRHGETLDPPELYDTEAMTALGWDKVLENETAVTSNMVVSAVYEEKVFKVVMYDYSMEEPIIIQDAKYGEPLLLPELEDDEDCVYLGSWDATISDSTEEDQIEISALDDLVITEDTYLYPHYVFLNTVEPPVISLASGSYTSRQQVVLNCDTESAVLYYTLNGEDPSTSPDAVRYTGPFYINETCDLRVIASAFNMNTSEEARGYYVINDGSGANQAVVTLCAFDEIVEIQKMDIGSKLSAALIPQFVGRSFAGVYKTVDYMSELDVTDELSYYQYSNAWDLNRDTIKGDVTLYLDYSLDSYNVQFLDYDGFILSEQTVPYGETASEPDGLSRDGYVFTGWDTDAYLSVTEDLTVTAVYVPENEYIHLELDKRSYTTFAGTSFNLVVDVFGNISDPELIWYSSNENVAVVSSDGTVTAIDKGFATISVMVVQNGESAGCDVTVYADASSELTLANTSYLTKTEDGLLLGFTVTTEDGIHFAPTVAEIRAQFLSENLVFTSISGTVLTDTDYIGTGTVIRFADGAILEQLTAIITGDLDGDGYITNRDASRAARYLVNKETLSDTQLAAIDVNGDGRVNNRDASMLARYLVGKETI